MESITRLPLMFAALAALTLSMGNAMAQHDHESTSSAKADKRVGDPYPFDSCPITGKKLGAMGDPLVKIYDGREVRFCCPSCPPKFEKDRAESLAKLDEKVVKDQSPLYPLRTSVVTGKDLPEKAYDYVYGNRLVRLGAETEKADFLKDPQKYLLEIDKATIAEQGKHYPLVKCPVSGDEYGGDMGKPIDVVVAGRLIRLCCKDCKKEIEADPAKFIAKVDAARKGKDHDHEGGEEPKPHDGK